MSAVSNSPRSISPFAEDVYLAPIFEVRINSLFSLADLKAFRPDLIGVSAGFDAYARDPLANGPLEAEDFHWLGSELRKVGVPLFSVLEGGYSDDLPQWILSYLNGVAWK